MAIKKAILNKVVSGVTYEVYPKTSSDIVTYSKTVEGSTVDTTVAAELAALATAIANGDAASLQAVNNLKQLVFDFQDGETISTTYDTIREIAAFLDQHDESIGQLAALITDVGHASTPESAEGAGDAVAATGLHLAVETNAANIAALQQANGTNVTKTYGGTTAANGHLYLDGTDTTVYDDTDLNSRLGASTDESAAAGTTAWSRIKNAETDIDNLEAGLGVAGANADASGTTAWSRIKNAEGDIDTLQAAVGSATDTADAEGTTAWARIKALEEVEATKVEDGTSNGYIKVNGTDDAIQVYDDTDLWASVGRSSDTAAAAGTTAWARIKNAEDDIDALEAKVGASTDTANASGTTPWSRVKNAEDDIDDLEAGLGTSGDTADASGTTAWSRIKAIEAWEDQVQLVSALPASPSEDVLYMVEIQ